MADLRNIVEPMGRYQDAPGLDTILSAMGGAQVTGPVLISLNALSATLPEITQGKAETAFGITVATAGSTLSSTSLRGLTLDSAARTLTGTATSAGTVTIVETLAGATNSPRTSTVLTVNPPVSVTATIPTNLTVGTAITPFTATATGGTGAKTWSLSGFPTGLSINSSGQVSGTPTAAGSFQDARIIATDNRGATGQITASISVAGGAAAYEYLPDFSAFAADTDLASVPGWAYEFENAQAQAGGFKARTRSDNGLTFVDNDSGYNGAVAYLYDPGRYELYQSFRTVASTADGADLLFAAAATDRLNLVALAITQQGDKMNVLSAFTRVNGVRTEVPITFTTGDRLLGNRAEVNFVLRRVAGSSVIQLQVVETGAIGSFDGGQIFGNKVGFNGLNFGRTAMIVRNLRFGEVAPANPSAAEVVVEDRATYTPQTKQFVVSIPDDSTFAQPQMRIGRMSPCSSHIPMAASTQGRRTSLLRPTAKFCSRASAMLLHRGR